MPYPPRTLNQLLAGIQCKMKELHPELPAMLNKDDFRFQPIHGTCDTVFRQLTILLVVYFDFIVCTCADIHPWGL